MSEKHPTRKDQLRHIINERNRLVAQLRAVIDQYRAERGEHVTTSRRKRRGAMISYIQRLQDKIGVLKHVNADLVRQLAASREREQHWRHEAERTAGANAALTRQLQELRSEPVASS